MSIVVGYKTIGPSLFNCFKTNPIELFEEENFYLLLNTFQKSSGYECYYEKSCKMFE